LFSVLEGYGGKLINAYQSMKNISQLGGNHSNKLEFPLILGRDFCGEIIRKGPQVTKFNVGDKVRISNKFFKKSIDFFQRFMEP
jgi:NADPH:quinone reductase-like Zn-dependent oxidoreductase